MSKQRRRDTTLTIRLTKPEKERIERNAKRAGRSITDYLVLLSLEMPIHVAEDVKPLLIELKRIGNNLNQITAKINAGAFRSYNFEDMAKKRAAVFCTKIAALNRWFTILECQYLNLHPVYLCSRNLNF